jgi:chromosome segregation ATPase
VLELGFSFALGALSVALLALAATPLMARRAMRLATSRARLMAPLDERAAQAERDALRAEHAVERSRLDRRVETANERTAALRADLGGEQLKSLRLTEARDGLVAEVAVQRSELASLASDLSAASADLAAAQVGLWDLEAQRDRATERWAEARRRDLAMEAAADRDRAHRAALEARGEALGIRIDDLDSRLARAGAALTRKEAALAEAVAQGEAASKEAASLRAALDARSREADGLRDRLDATARERSRFEEAYGEALMDGARKLAQIGERDQAARDSAEHANAMALRAQTAEAAHAAVEGALAASRRQVTELQARLAASAPSAESDEALREAIAQLGVQVERFGAPRSNRRPRGGALIRPSQMPPIRREDPIPPVAAAAMRDEPLGQEIGS